MVHQGESGQGWRIAAGLWLLLVHGKVGIENLAHILDHWTNEKVKKLDMMLNIFCTYIPLGNYSLQCFSKLSSYKILYSEYPV